jgi:hypothetical protein
MTCITEMFIGCLRFSRVVEWMRGVCGCLFSLCRCVFLATGIRFRECGWVELGVVFLWKWSFGFWVFFLVHPV